MKHAIALLALVGLLAGCATTFTVKPGARPEVVYAEYSAETYLNLTDSFLAWERRNELALKMVDPFIHKAANEIRDDGAKWWRELRTATKAYKANPNQGTRTALETAQQFLDMAIQEMREAMAKGQGI